MLARDLPMLGMLILILIQSATEQQLVVGPPTDNFSIRHGRSKVRHSNEKEHLIWELQHGGTPQLRANANATRNPRVGYESVDDDELWSNLDANRTVANQISAAGISSTSTAITLIGTIPTPAEFSMTSARPTPTATSSSTSTLTAVTHKIRKLHKKKIMESIRNSVDKSLGLHLSKNHRSLVQAEHLQGRPTDVLDSDMIAVDNDPAGYEAHTEGVSIPNIAVDGDAGDELDEVLQLADELDLDNALPPQVSNDDSNNNDNDNNDNNDNNDSNSSNSSSNSSSNDDNLVGADDKEDDESANENENEDDNEMVDDVDVAYPNDEYVTTVATVVLHQYQSQKQSKKLAQQVTYAATTLVPALDAAAAALDIVDEEETETEPEVSATVTANEMETRASSHYKPNAGVHDISTPASYKRGKLDYYAIANEVLAELTNRLGKNQTLSMPVITETYNKVSKGALDNAQSTFAIEDQEIAMNDESSLQDKESMNNRSIEQDGVETVSHIPSKDITLSDEYWLETNSLGPSQSASTSVGGIGLDRQQLPDLEEITFEDVGLEGAPDGSMDDGLIDNRHANGFPVIVEDGNAVSNGDDENVYETNRFLAGVIDAANEDEFSDWDEISRNNRRNLMRGRDVVTKFLQIVETQHSLGSNCEAGTSLNLGEGVVDRYAQDRFRVEAEVAVNRANMLTRIFKMTSREVQSDVNLLHASVLSMVEFDDDIFAAGNCFDWNEHPPQQGLFCPFAYRLPPPHLGAILAKDLATEYHYLGNTSEWFFQARKNAEKVIARNEQYLKAFHLYSNKTEERIEDDTLAVKYEDGRWSKPYYDCGGGNIWMLTYTVPFFGYENSTYHFKGTSGIDIDLRRVDIDQCPQRNTPGMTQPLNIFAGTDKCKQRTTMCEALKGLGFRRGSYKCVCRKGYYFPDTISMQKFFNGSLLEEEYEKLMLGKNSTYNIIHEYECLPCAEGCDYCEDASPCIAALNWPMRTSILVLACTVIGLLPPAAWFTFRYQQVKVVRAASPALLRVIALGAFFIYCTNIVMYPNPNLYTCTARIWMREIGFSLTYGALMLKTWRISVIFRVRSAKAVKITDASLLKRLGIICGVIGTCLLVRTLVSPPDVVVGRTADDLKAFLCKTDWWDYTFTSMEVLFLAWGVRLCIMVRKAPSEFNESRFISMAIYNEFLLTCFLNVSMLFLQSPANPDLLYIIFFCHTQLTVTLLLGLIFGSKVYIVLRSGKSHQESVGLGVKASGAKFNFRPQVRTFANPSSVTTSTVPMAGTTSAETKLSDQEALEEIRQLSMQLQRIQEMAPPKGVAVMTISSLLDGLKTPGGMMMVAAAATQAMPSGHQLMLRPQLPQHSQGALPLLTLNNEMQRYCQQQQQLQMQMPQNNNISSSKLNANTNNLPPVEVSVAPTITSPPKSAIECRERIEIAVNTDLSGENFRSQLQLQMQTHSKLQGDAHIVCSHCMQLTRESCYTCRPQSPPNTPPPPPPLPTACQQLGSPKPEGSISFSNIKLACMCSQPDEVFRPTAASESVTTSSRRVNVRSAATNTPPPLRGSSRHRGKKPTTHSSASLHDDRADADRVSYQICDKCRKKYHSHSSSSRKSSHKRGTRSHDQRRVSHKTSTKSASRPAATSTATASGISQARSHDLLDRRPTTVIDTAAVRSTDDIIFYSTTDDNSSDHGDDSDRSGSRSSNSHSDTSKRTRQLLRETRAICEFGLQTSASVTVLQHETPASIDIVKAPVEATPAPPIIKTDSETVEIGNVSDVGGGVADASGTSSGTGNGSGNGNNKSNGNRSKRPDKLVLDLNDRSKYTKEVSV